MTTPQKPTTRVRLKRAYALDFGDRILPGKGLFFRNGTRIRGGMAEEWGDIAWHVISPDPDFLSELCIGVALSGDIASNILHCPADAYVVLAD